MSRTTGPIVFTHVSAFSIQQPLPWYANVGGVAWVSEYYNPNSPVYTALALDEQVVGVSGAVGISLDAGAASAITVWLNTVPVGDVEPGETLELSFSDVPLSLSVTPYAWLFDLRVTRIGDFNGELLGECPFTLNSLTVDFTIADDEEPVGECFWTDLLNVTQECEDDEDQASYNILYDDGHTWTGGDGYDPYYLCVALPFNLSADVWTSYPATSTSVLEDKTDGYFGAYLFLFFGYNYPDSGWPGDRLFFVVRDTRTGTNLFTQDMEALGQSVVRMEIDFDVDLPAPAWAFEVGFAETENGPLISFANEPTYEVNSTRAMAIVHKKSRRGIRVDFIGVASSTPVENEVFRYGGEDVPFDGPPPLYDVSTAGLVGAMLLSEEPQRGDYVDSELFVWRPAHDPIWLDAGVSEGEFVLYDYNLMTALGLSDPVPPGTWVLGCFMHDHAPTFHRRGVLFIAFQVP